MLLHKTITRRILTKYSKTLCDKPNQNDKINQLYCWGNSIKTSAKNTISNLSENEQVAKMVNFSNSVKEGTKNVVTNIPKDYVNKENLMALTAPVSAVTTGVNNQIKSIKRILMFLVVIMSLFLVIYGMDKVTDILVKIKKLREE